MVFRITFASAAPPNKMTFDPSSAVCSKRKIYVLCYYTGEKIRNEHNQRE